MNERTAHAALAARSTSRQDVIRALGCSSDACGQGRRPCPTPEACALPDRSDIYDADGTGLLRWLAIGIVLVFGALMVAHFIARLTS
jgi:hypothetical protein